MYMIPCQLRESFCHSCPVWPSRLFWVVILGLLGCNAGIEGSNVPDVQARLASLAADYGIELVSTGARFPVATTHGTIRGKGSSPEALDLYVGLFCEEFRVYPRILISRTRLKRVVLCENLSFFFQLRSAVPDFENNTLYLDVSRGSDSPSYLRRVIHHEFFHMIDLRDDGQLYGDPTWAALNPPSVKYGTGGVNAQDIPTTSILTERYPGFLNHYSTTGVEEDKAEMFAHLIIAPGEVRRRAETDLVLARKVEQLKILMARYCGEINDDFWKAAEQKR